MPFRQCSLVHFVNFRKTDEPNYFIEYLQRKLLAANFLSYDIESAFIKFALF